MSWTSVLASMWNFLKNINNNVNIMHTVFMNLSEFFIFTLLLCSLPVIKAQTLDDYISIGLENNIVLEQKHIALDKALLSLQAAKSMYIPDVSLFAGYSTAEGGRNIALPVGDMLNPVYSTLNMITQSQTFPAIENQAINFLPKNYYDAKIRATMPLFNTDIKYNRQIQARQVILKEYEIQLYRRVLVKDIKSAYYQYLLANEALQVYQNALLLAKESKRVNEKLLESGKGLHAYVIRSESEIAQIEYDILEAEKNINNAGLYFNLLLNRNADDEINADLDLSDVIRNSLTEALKYNQPVDREELKMLNAGIDIYKTVHKMNATYYMPRLSGFVDIGSQAEGLVFDNNSRYFMAGLQLEMPIFQGNRNKLKVQEAELEVKNAELQLENAERQIELTSTIARNNLELAIQKSNSAETRFRAAETYYRLIDKGFQSGVNTYLETIDARTQLTIAEILYKTSLCRILVAKADLERELGINH